MNNLDKAFFQPLVDRDKEIDNFNCWLEKNKDLIVERYRDSIEDIDNVPEDFIERQYEKYCEGD